MENLRFLVHNQSEYPENTVAAAYQVEVARGLISFSITLGVVYTLWFILTVKRAELFTKRMRQQSKASRTKRSLYHCVMASVVMLLLNHITNFTQVAIATTRHDLIPTKLEYYACDYAVVISVTFYILISTSTYLTMFLRASAVLDKTVTQRWIIYLKWVVCCGTLCAPFFIGLIQYTGEYRGTVLVVNGVHHCLIGASTFVNIFFIGADTCISAGYLTLFIYPVLVTNRLLNTENESRAGKPLKITGTTNSVDQESVLMKVAKKNLKWSMFTIGVTFISVGMGGVSAAWSHRNAFKGAAFNSVYFLAAGVIDLTVKTVACLAISNNIPPISWCCVRQNAKSKSKLTAVRPVEDTNSSNLFPATDVDVVQ